MNAALKYNTNPAPPASLVTGDATDDGQWMKVLGTIIFCACIATLAALASVWLKLEIDQKYQAIDEIKIKNARIRIELNKLEATASKLRSLDRVQADLAAAGVVMQLPTAAFFLDESSSSGYVAFTKDDGLNGSI